jgi:nitroimidazol reductase NimA-like FMN-containing flavoprotein (pyridoxamine 5'-phosphate oxidase superfamily)
MRRSDREIKSKKQMESIIGQVKVCRVGFADSKKPYVLAFNFGYGKRIFYIHCAAKGRKLDIIKKNNNVCVEIDTGHELKASENACEHSFGYKSVIAEGKAAIISSGPEKIKALKIIMRQQTGKDFTDFKQNSVDKIVILKITVSRMSGKQSG